jgi:mono/diheme cytochrome c family protein
MTKRIQAASILLLAASIAAPAFAQGTGADTYKKCAMCHGADGTGKAAMNVKSFKDPAIAKMSDTAYIEITANGKNKMPAYSGKLTPAQIKDVVAYIRTLQK